MRIFDNKNKTTDRYTILLGKSYNDAVYTMSENANMPDGVNIFIGENGQDGVNVDEFEDEEIGLSDLPKGTLIAIIRRIEQE